MNFFLRRTGYFAALGIVGVYALIAFHGPQGVPVLREKRKEIENLQGQNADLTRDRSQMGGMKSSPMPSTSQDPTSPSFPVST